jgi:hypothetical protein
MEHRLEEGGGRPGREIIVWAHVGARRYCIVRCMIPFEPRLLQGSSGLFAKQLLRCYFEVVVSEYIGAVSIGAHKRAMTHTWGQKTSLLWTGIRKVQFCGNCRIIQESEYKLCTVISPLLCSSENVAVVIKLDFLWLMNHNGTTIIT